MNTGGKAAFPHSISPSKMESLLWVESGAAVIDAGHRGRLMFWS